MNSKVNANDKLNGIMKSISQAKWEIKSINQWKIRSKGFTKQNQINVQNLTFVIVKIVFLCNRGGYPYNTFKKSFLPITKVHKYFLNLLKLEAIYDLIYVTKSTKYQSKMNKKLT